MTLARDTDQLESDRLILRRITPADFEFYIRLQADPEVARYIGHGLPRSREESLKWLSNTLSTYESMELGQLAVVRKSDGQLLGRCGVATFFVEADSKQNAIRRGWFTRAEVPADVEVTLEREHGYTFDRSAWGNGYASEATRCVLDYMTQLGQHRIVSIIHSDNTRSLRVAGRAGATLEGQVSVWDRVFNLYRWPVAPDAAST